MVGTTTTTTEDRWSDEHFHGMAQLWRFDEKQQAQMREVQEHLSDLDHWKNDPYEVARYFKEFKTVSKTAKMMRDMIAWREENDMENFLERYGEPDPAFHYLPTTILEGLDKDGDPIYVDRMGAADQWGFHKRFGTHGMADYIKFIRELTTRRAYWKDYEQEHGRRIKNFNILIDMDGLGTAHMRPGLMPQLQHIARVDQDNYAGWAKRIILLRAPKLFFYIWKFAKHFFDEHIRDMIVITTHDNYVEIMSEFMDVEHLPECMVPGVGRGKGMPGYLEKVLMEGGPLPSEQEIQRRQEEQDLIKPKQINFERFDSTVSAMTCTSATTATTWSGSDVSVTGSLVMKGYYEDDAVTGSIITAFPASSNSLSTLDE